MRVIILRHGETLANATNIIEGHKPGKLSKKGIEQAKKVALRLKNERIDLILCSDLTRALETAKQIRSHHLQTTFLITKKLRETYFGRWEGKSREYAGFKDGYKPPLPADAETREESYNRAKKFLEETSQKFLNKTVLIVTHNAFYKSIVAVITGKTHEEIGNMETYHNTGLSIFTLSDNKSWYNILHNCRKHLD